MIGSCIKSELCYDEIYKQITAFFEDNSGSDWDIRLKDEFSLEYLKKYFSK